MHDFYWRTLSPRYLRVPSCAHLYQSVGKSDTHTHKRTQILGYTCRPRQGFVYLRACQLASAYVCVCVCICVYMCVSRWRCRCVGAGVGVAVAVDVGV